MVNRNLTYKLRRPLSLITAITLALQSILLGGVWGGFPALAATATFNFTTAGEYTPTANFSVFDGTAHFKASWSDISSGLPATGSVTRLITPATAGLVWTVTDILDGAYKSTDYGATWNNVSINANFQLRDGSTISGDAGANAVNIVLVGEDSGDSGPAIAWSTNSGAGWTYDNTLPGATGLKTVAHKATATVYTWALMSDGTPLRTTDIDADPWLPVAPTGLTTGDSLLWIEDEGLLLASGATDGDGKVFYSTDYGTT